MNNESKVLMGAKDSKYILNLMSNFFVVMFEKAYGHIDSKRLIEMMDNAIDGLLPEEIEYGLKEMCKQKFMPNFGGFRALCEEANIWKSGECAWDEVIQYEKMNINHINTVVKRVIDLIKSSQTNDYLQDKKHFIKKYQQEVAFERSLGNRPELYVRQNEIDCTNQNWAPCNKEEAKIHLDKIRYLIKG